MPVQVKARVEWKPCRSLKVQRDYSISTDNKVAQRRSSDNYLSDTVKNKPPRIHGFHPRN